MKIARILTEGEVWFASIEPEGARLISTDSTSDLWALGAQQHPVPKPRLAPEPDGDFQLLAPVYSPQKIVAVGLNYKDHATEQGKPLPKAPMLFSKSPGAIIGPDAPIVFSLADSDCVDYEGELAVVIGTRARNVSSADALAYVFGYTICNDVSARDAQRDDIQYFRAKSFDTFCPLGPWVVTTDELPDPQQLNVRTWVNGELRQDGTTAEMIFSVADVVAYVSRFMTLEPGDIITTGTPAGVGSGFDPPRYLRHGDVVDIEIEGIGHLRNPVIINP